MTVTMVAPGRPNSVARSIAVVGRGIGWGSVAGFCVGAVAGTFVYPLVVTFLGAIVGAGIGVAFGAVCGVVLAVVAAWTDRLGAFRLAGATSAAACATVLVAGLSGTTIAPAGWVIAIFVATCAGVGLLVGPTVALGPPVEFGWEYGRRPLSSMLAADAGRGAAVGALVGGGVGLVIGLASHPPTAPAAMVEVAVFGTVPGVVLGLSVGAVALTYARRRRP